MADLERLWAAKVPLAEIADRLERTRAAVDTRVQMLRSQGRDLPLRGTPRAWTHEEETLLIRLAREPLTAAEIAEKLGRTAAGVQIRLGLLRERGASIGRRYRGSFPRDDARLLELWGGPKHPRQIVAELGISLPTLYRRINELRAAGESVPDRRWAPDREARLRTLAHLPIEQIAQDLQMPFQAVRARMLQLGLFDPDVDPAASWRTDDDAELLRLWAAGESLPDIARRLGRTQDAVNSRVGVLRREGRDLPLRFQPRAWTDEDDECVIDLWNAGCTTVEIAAALERSKGSVSARVHELRCRGHDLPRRQPRRDAGLMCGFTYDQLRMAKALWNAATLAEIAERVGCGESTLLRRVNVLRLRGETGFPERHRPPRHRPRERHAAVPAKAITAAA